MRVSVSGVQISSVSGPRERGAVRSLSVLAKGGQIKADFVNHELGLQIPDLDAGDRGSNQPVSVGREHQAVDDFVGFKDVESLALGQVPEHSHAILST